MSPKIFECYNDKLVVFGAGDILFLKTQDEFEDLISRDITLEPFYTNILKPKIYVAIDKNMINYIIQNNRNRWVLRLF